MPFWGGPTGLGSGAAAGQPGLLVRPVQPAAHDRPLPEDRPLARLRPTAAGGIDVYTATPGVPGDSGSGFLDDRGRAVGTLSTVAIAPLAGSNGLGNLARELDFAQRHSGISGLRLVKGGRAVRRPSADRVAEPR